MWPDWVALPAKGGTEVKSGRHYICLSLAKHGKYSYSYPPFRPVPFFPSILLSPPFLKQAEYLSGSNQVKNLQHSTFLISSEPFSPSVQERRANRFWLEWIKKLAKGNPILLPPMRCLVAAKWNIGQTAKLKEPRGTQFTFPWFNLYI